MTAQIHERAFAQATGYGNFSSAASHVASHVCAHGQPVTVTCHALAEIQNMPQIITWTLCFYCLCAVLYALQKANWHRPFNGSFFIFSFTGYREPRRPEKEISGSTLDPHVGRWLFRNKKRPTCSTCWLGLGHCAALLNAAPSSCLAQHSAVQYRMPRQGLVLHCVVPVFNAFRIGKGQ